MTVLSFHDLHLGDEWVSLARTVTEADIVQFAGISGDFNPLHMDHEAARQGPFGKPVAHGLLGLAMLSGLGSQAPLVRTLAFLEILEWKFLEPIAAGDTLHVLTSIEDLQPQARGRRGVVTWNRRLLNQHNRVVQEGRTRTLVQGTTPAGSSRSGRETLADSV